MQLKGFVGPSYTLQSFNIECQRAVNIYPQMDETGTGKNVAALIGTPGLKVFTVLDEGKPVRGMLTTSTGRLFAVTFTTLWEVMGDGTKINRGTLNSSAGFVGMAENGQEMMLVDGPNGYTYGLIDNSAHPDKPQQDVLTPIGDNFPGGATVVFQDGFFIFNQPDTQVFWVTSPYSTDVDGTMFASAESNPDKLLAILSSQEMLWLFGTTSTEVWYDSGDPNFPFARVQGGTIQFGLAAARTPVRFYNTVAWLGRNEQGKGVVYMANGLQPARISTHALEQEMARYPTIEDATGYTYQQDGHEFYVLNFPSANKMGNSQTVVGATWVYDAITQLWHERAYTGSRGLERHRGEIHVEAFGNHIVSDWKTGTLYIMDRFALNDAGKSITRIRSTPFIADELKNIFFSKLTLDMRMGVGADGQLLGAPEPQCMLQWSDDGGNTWSNEYWISLGAIGATLKRAIWRRLGRSRQRVFRFTITDDCQIAINDAYIEVQEGSS